MMAGFFRRFSGHDVTWHGACSSGYRDRVFCAAPSVIHQWRNPCCIGQQYF